ncbi:MAG TPA: hypothetical protein VFU56_03235 [Gaiellaceae bacterium]|nr:hypothetical protein [Gaiellaceae bacterium]
MRRRTTPAALRPAAAKRPNSAASTCGHVSGQTLREAAPGESEASPRDDRPKTRQRGKTPVEKPEHIDVLATAIWCGLDLEQLELLDLGYAPPFSGVYDPLLIAARQTAKRAQ